MNLLKKRVERKRQAHKSTSLLKDQNLINYDSEGERKQSQLKKIKEHAENLNNKNKNFDPLMNNSGKDKQVIFCTRTHTQISQLINEIKKVEKFRDLVVVPLIGRRGLCVHEKVMKAQNMSSLNDRCLDQCESSNGGCKHRDPELLEVLEDNLVNQVHDIEELEVRCQRTKICGYYASRNVAVYQADIIVVPYQTILSESAREAVGITSLSDKIIIFDEAHNLLETISSINSVEVSHLLFSQA